MCFENLLITLLPILVAIAYIHDETTLLEDFGTGCKLADSVLTWIAEVIK